MVEENHAVEKLCNGIEGILEYGKYRIGVFFYKHTYTLHDSVYTIYQYIKVEIEIYRFELNILNFHITYCSLNNLRNSMLNQGKITYIVLNYFPQYPFYKFLYFCLY